tara:strand:- start:42 stop:593 length:552 start_codon:yes stop_codon:yes gene_type:complete
MKDDDQLLLFEEPKIEHKVNNIVLRPIKLETIFPEIIPNKHVLYPTNGYHPFYSVAEEGSKYKKKIWPFIQTCTEFPHRGTRIIIATIRISTLNGYPMVSLYDKSQPEPVPKMVHVVVGKCYVPNPDPDNMTQVCHIEDENCNYLPQYLKWDTPSRNHKGKSHWRKSELEDEYAYCKKQGWIQ